MALPRDVTGYNNIAHLERLERNRKKRNPLILEYRHRLDGNGLMAAEDVVFYWDKIEINGVFRSCNVRAVFHPIIEIGEDILRHQAWREFCSGWFSSFGNDSRGWFVTSGRTPEHLYGSLLAEQFVDDEERFLALAEFARVQECGWARKMLVGVLDAIDARRFVNEDADPFDPRLRAINEIAAVGEIDAAVELIVEATEVRREFEASAK
jgi:hypothetical protein